MSISLKMNKICFMRTTKNLCTSKHKKFGKVTHRMERKTLFNKGLMSQVYRELTELNNKTNDLPDSK
jgi:hypothetical protein